MTTPLVHSNLVTLEQVLRKYAEDFAAENHAAKVITRGLSLVGIGIRPILDHWVFRSIHPLSRIKEFQDLGYVRDPDAKVFSEKKMRVEVYRCTGMPAILVEEAHDHEAHDWVKTFGDQKPYVMAVRVENLEESEMYLEKQGIGFIRPSAGKTGEEIREIASYLTIREGKTVNALLLVERHAGNLNYYAPGFWAKA
jgi:hypothetical protein